MRLLLLLLLLPLLLLLLLLLLLHLHVLTLPTSSLGRSSASTRVTALREGHAAPLLLRLLQLLHGASGALLLAPLRCVSLVADAGQSQLPLDKSAVASLLGAALSALGTAAEVPELNVAEAVVALLSALVKRHSRSVLAAVPLALRLARRLLMAAAAAINAAGEWRRLCTLTSDWLEVNKDPCC